MIFVVILVLVQNVDCRSTGIKFKKNSEVQNVWNQVRGDEKNSTIKEQGRGFFLGGKSSYYFNCLISSSHFKCSCWQCVPVSKEIILVVFRFAPPYIF